MKFIYEKINNNNKSYNRLENILKNFITGWLVDLEQEDENRIRRIASEYNLTCDDKLERNQWGGPCSYGLGVEGKAEDIYKFLTQGLKWEDDNDLWKREFYRMVYEAMDEYLED